MDRHNKLPGEEEDLWNGQQGFGLDANGNIEGAPRPVVTRPQGELELARPLRGTEPSPPEEELELARDLTRNEPGGLVVPSERRNVLRPIFGLAVVAAIIAAGWFAWPYVRRPVERALPRAAAPMLRIDSSPSGAEVLAAGQPIGQTPLMLDNVYPDREIPLEIRLSGFETWRGKFHGNADASVDARLVRKGGGKAR